MTAGRAPPLLPPIPHDMEEDRRREHDRVEAVEDAAVAFDHVAPVLHAPVALDRGHHEAAEEAHQADHEGDGRGLARGERGDAPQRGAERGGAGDAADQAFPRL